MRLGHYKVWLLLLFVNTRYFSQDSSSVNPLTISGYTEVYYCYDFSEPSNHIRPSFFYCYNKHDEVTLNLGMLKVNYSSGKIRGNFGLMVGTYPQYNLSSEPGLLKNIFEFNAGFKVAKKANLWLEAGILPSHIGFESAIGKDCWNLTRSMLADNSPYYETGLKLGYTSKNEKIYFALLALNGWQRIKPTNQRASFGTQLTFKPKSTVTLNWSTFAGNVYSDSLARWRYFNNLYGQFQLSKKTGAIIGFDIGFEQLKKDTWSYNIWYSPVVILQYKLNNKLWIAGRVEYYMDDKQVIILTGTKNGFQTLGYSLNFDYFINSNTTFRIEGRFLKGKDKTFTLNKRPTNENYFLTGSLAISF
jgi:hypothetical protein